MSGSLMGGTAIHIKASGLSLDPTQTTILLQNSGSTIAFPCNIPADGIVDGALTCITTPSNKQVSNLMINIYTNINSIPTYVPFATQSSYTYSYQNSFTPVVYDIFPAVAIGNTMLNYYGIHRISDLGDGLRNMGDIIKMKVGN
jgi:hypothetical protein